MYPPINPISTRLETSKYPLDSSVKPSECPWNPITTVIDISAYIKEETKK